MAKKKNVDVTRAITLAQEVADWWREWCESANPTDMEDPPIDELRDELLKLSGLPDAHPGYRDRIARSEFHSWLRTREDKVFIDISDSDSLVDHTDNSMLLQIGPENGPYTCAYLDDGGALTLAQSIVTYLACKKS